MTFVKASETNELLEYPARLFDLKTSFPNTSFPKDLSNADLSDYGFYTVVEQSVPEYNTDTQYIREADPQFVENQWQQVWEIIDFSSEELSAINASKSEGIRSQRNELLAKCDWTQLADCSLSDTDKAAWVTYRQALRDLPASEGFPNTVTWPTEPS